MGNVILLLLALAYAWAGVLGWMIGGASGAVLIAVALLGLGLSVAIMGIRSGRYS